LSTPVAANLSTIRSLLFFGMQVFAIKNDALEPEQDIMTKKDGNVTKAIRRGGRGSRVAKKTGEDREDLRNVVTFWHFENEVERSRLSSTFEQLRLHDIFANTLCDEMQQQKGICTPLGLEQLQSEHLFSWHLSFGPERLKEFLGRTYDLKKRDVIDRMTESILEFKTENKSQCTVNGNSKFSSGVGTLRKARFGTNI